MDHHFLPYRPERDVYQLLGVDPRADQGAIVVACRRLARHLHPDYNASPRATEEMQVVNAVRRLMSDPRSRARYDSARHRWLLAAARARWSNDAPASRSAWRAAAPALSGRRASPLGRVSRYVRVVRAALIGVRAGLVALGPPRCERCRTVVTGGDRFCPACGTPQIGTRAPAGQA